MSNKIIFNEKDIEKDIPDNAKDEIKRAGGSVEFYLKVEEKRYRAKRITLHLEDYLPDSPDYYPVYKFGLNNLEKECLICIENFKCDDDVLALPCLHLYHKECIYGWFEHHNTCPECKHSWFKMAGDTTVEGITNRLAVCSI